MAWWKFDEGYGTTVYDSAGSNDGTMTFMSTSTNGAWGNEEECKSGKCLLFDGSDDYVSITSATYDLDAGATFEFWARRSSWGVNSGVLGKSDDNNNRWIKFRSTDSLDIETDTNNDWARSETIPFRDSGWHHYAVISDGYVVSFYQDGVDIGATDNVITNDITLDTISGSSVSDNPAYSPPFNGHIDDVKIYDYARSAAQIKTDYLATAGGRGGGARVSSAEESLAQSEGLVAHYKFDETYWSTSTGNIALVLDSSGGGNHLSPQGNATSTATSTYGRAGTFDGAGDYLCSDPDNDGDCDDDNDLDMGTSDFTIEAWVKTSASGGATDYVILDKRTGTPNWTGYYVALDQGDSKANFVIFDVSSTEGKTSSVINDGNWHHIAGSFDRDDNLSVYLDGNLSSQTDISTYSSSDISSANQFSIGQKSPSASSMVNFNGFIDDVKIYKTARSASQIRRDYETGPPPVAHWKFDENSGDSAQDTSGANTGTLKNMDADTDWVAGKYGSALDFDGSVDYVRVADDASLDIGTTDFTIEAWVKPAGDDWKTIISKQVKSTNNGDDGWVLVIRNVANSRHLLWYDQARGTAANFGTGSKINNGVWTHIAITKSYTGETLGAYVNGVFTSSVSSPASDINVVHELRIGTNGYGNFDFEGLIDDVRIYNYARTQKQIMEDMLGSPKLISGGGNAGGAVGAWSFDEMQGATTYDSSIQANNGTLLGEMATSTAADSGWTNEGKFGSALAFDGTDDHVKLSPDASLNFNTQQEFTLSVWIKTNVLDGTADRIIGKISANQGYVLQIDDNKIFFRTGTGSDTETLIGNTVLTDTNQWYHFVAVFNSGTKIVYLNGVQDNTVSSVTFVDLTDAVSIGSNNNFNGNYFDGKIDEVTIYPFALTPEEVKQEYNRGVSAQMGSLSTESDGITMSDSAAREYCVPGSTDLCLPPVAHWRMDEMTGQYANDTSTSTNTGTLGSGATADTSDPTWQITGCKIGACLFFDGVDDYVLVSDDASLDDVDDLTIELWVNLDSPVGIQGLLGKRSSAENAGAYNIFLYTPGRVDFEVYNSDNDFQACSKSISLEGLAGGWHQFAVVYSDSLDKVWLYKDGVSLGSCSSITYTIQRNYHNLVIGYNGHTSFGFADGQIDDVRIYNYARTPAQIAWDYNRGGPVGWWKMDEGQDTETTCDATGSVVYDYAPGANGKAANANPGTLILQPAGNTSTSTAWAVGKSNCALDFDGTDDYVDVGDLSVDIQTVSFWLNPDSTTEKIIDLDGTYTIEISSGAVDFTGTTTETIYVDGISAATVASGSWQHIVTTIPYGIDANDVDIGRISASYFDGTIDDLRIFNYALTPTQIKNVYNEGAAVRFGPASGLP